MSALGIVFLIAILCLPFLGFAVLVSAVGGEHQKQGRKIKPGERVSMDAWYEAQDRKATAAHRAEMKDREDATKPQLYLGADGIQLGLPVICSPRFQRNKKHK